MEPFLAVLAFAWPFIAVWLSFRLAPQLVTKFLEKEIDRRSEARLAAIKGEIEGAYTTLRTSAEILSESSSGMRPHIVEAARTLWGALVSLKERASGAMTFDAIFLVSEIEAMFANPSEAKYARALEYVSAYQNANRTIFAPEAHGPDLDRARLFSGERLWLIFYITRAVLMRSIVLIAFSYDKGAFQDWRSDKGIEQLAITILPREEFEKLKAQSTYALTSLIARLEGEFLHEAARVMAGSKAIADNLASVQATMLLEHAKVGEREWRVTKT